MKKYLWCEDSGSGYQFWSFIFSVLYPDIIVEAKGGNVGLRKAARGVHSDGNTYFILMDTVIDNPDTIRETRQLIREIHGKDNIVVIKIHSFEFVLLSFELLEYWVFAKVDELKDKRQNLFRARELLIRFLTSEGTGSELLELKGLLKEPENKNTEQIAAKLLFEITRNTGFETTKGKLGQCFFSKCCEWRQRQNDDICGLDNNRISAEEKAQILADKSILRETFERAGLS